MDDIHGLYKEHVPAIMSRRSGAGKSEALAHLAKTVFMRRTFAEVKTGVGIVAMRWDFEKPMIFKGSVAQVHGRQSTFVPGFGCTFADAVQASCSAYPLFEKHVVATSTGERVELIDGGYCANNPTLYAIADAVMALRKLYSDLRVVSIGVGVYPEPRRWRSWLAKCFLSVQVLQKTLNIHTVSMEQLRTILFKDMWAVRINDSFERPERATDCMESDLRKLDMLYQRGGESFTHHESALKEFFDNGAVHAKDGVNESWPFPNLSLRLGRTTARSISRAVHTPR